MSSRNPPRNAWGATARAVRFAPAWRDQPAVARPMLASFLIAPPAVETPQ